jgi:hypothetical protein
VLSSILPHNAQDIYDNLNYKLNRKDSIFEESWPFENSENIQNAI